MENSLVKKRKTGLKVLLGFFLFIIAIGFFIAKHSLSYSTHNTHPALTEEIAKFHNLKNSAPKISRKEIKWMKEGSIEEDEPPRWINHFYDPINNVGWTGKHYGDLSQEDGYQKGASMAPKPPIASIDWAVNQEYQAAYGREYGNRTWQKAIKSYIGGNKKMAFLALGDILHLIEDLSVPAHTRDDSHPGIGGDPGSPYEDYAKDTTNLGVLTVAQDLIKDNKLVPDFKKLADAFNYLAKYSNKNFFSEDTINNNDFKEPNLKNLEKKIKNINGDKILFLKKNNEYLAFYSIKRGKYSINDEDFVLPSYRSHLFPKAVLVGAGVIDLFFRDVEKYKKNPELLEPIVRNSKEPFFQALKAAPKIMVIKANDFLDRAAVAVEVSAYKAVKKAKKEVAGAANNIKKTFQKPPIAPSQIVAGAGGITGALKPVMPVKPVKPDKPNIARPDQPDKKTNGSGQSDAGGVPPPSQSDTPLPDTTPPAAPVIISPSDFSPIFISPEIVFSGTAEASSTISTDFNSSTTSADSSGAWSLSLTFGQGSTTLDFFSADSAGNISSSTEVSLFVDSEAPDIFLAFSECSDSLSAGACLVATTTLNISWSSSANDLAYFTVNNNGVFSTTTATSAVVADAADNSNYSFSVSARDIAGNFSATSTRAAEISTMPVVINEVAWMGAGANATTSKDEWMELYNRTSRDIDISGWRLFSSDGGPDIVFGRDSKNRKTVNSVIPAKGYYLIERTNDSSVNDISADWFGSFGNGLDDYGEKLALSSASTTIDETPLGWSGKWPAGSKYSRYTMERYDPDVFGGDVSNWGTNNGIVKNGKNVEGNPIFGTPKKRNSANYLINKGGNITSDIALAKENSPYFVGLNDILITNGAVLTIEPGTIIKFYSGGIDVKDGKIIARGTESEPIVFTSFYDDDYGGDTNSDGVCEPANASSTALCPSPGVWMGVNVESDGSVFDHTLFRYGGPNGYYFKANLSILDSSADIENSIFEQALLYGLKLKNSSSKIANNIFRYNNSKNASTGLRIEGGGSSVISSNSFLNNSRGLSIAFSTPNVASNTFSSSTDGAIYSNGHLGMFTGNSGTNNGINGIIVAGKITSVGATTTLGINELPYMLKTYDADVVASSTLVIPPGIILKALAARLNVFGNLMVNGENPDDIVFTSFYDDSVGGDTNNDGVCEPDNASSTAFCPGPGYWNGFWMKPGSYSDIRGATFRYADTALTYENSPMNLYNVDFFSNNATTTSK